MILPTFAVKVIESDPYRSVVLTNGSLIFAECNGSGKQNVASEIARRCNAHDDLLEALVRLTGMAAAFPSELHAGHPDVVAAQEVLTRLAQGG